MKNKAFTEDESWFSSWFDTPYYHALYDNRNDEEAEAFIGRLMQGLNLRDNASILDLPCGKGRHALSLHRLGYEVTGADLSPSNIKHCLSSHPKDIRFFQHDMRNPLGIRAYDAVLNLFTSFGYFRYDFENMRVVQSAADSLKHGGLFVLDYLNIQPAMKNLVEAETVEKHGFTFQLQRFVENNSLIKLIRVIDGNECHEFREEVNLLSRIDFERYFAASGLEITAVYGDYHLGEFQQEDSPRLIFITRLT